MNESIRAGTVGVGRLGREHVRVLAGLSQVKLAGVYDKNPERGQAEAARYGVSQAESLEALIDQCDLVSVVTPTHTHFEIARQIIEAGKACFVEKPVCATASEADELVSLAARHRVPLGVGHIERYNPAFTAFLKEPVKPRFIEAHRLAPFTSRGTDVAVVFDLMIHDIDLLLHLLGQEPSDIRAAGAAVVSDDLDICNARLEFAQGAVANLTASRISTFRMRRFRMFAESSYVALDLQERTLERYRLFDSSLEAEVHRPDSRHMTLGARGHTLAVDKSSPEGPEMLQAELADFVRSVTDGAKPPITGEDGLRALRVAEQVHEEAHRLLKRAQIG